MDVLSVLRACARRWYVFLLVAGVGLTSGIVRYEHARPVYSITTQLVVLNSSGQSLRSSSHRVGSNPYAAQLPVAAAAFAGTATSDGAITSVQARGFSAKFTASAEQQGSIISVTARDSQFKTLPEALLAFLAEAKDQFRQLQLRAGADPDQLLQVQALGSPDAPSASYPLRSRTLGAIVLGSAVLAGLASLAVDVALLAAKGRRRKRRDALRRQNAAPSALASADMS